MANRMTTQRTPGGTWFAVAVPVPSLRLWTLLLSLAGARVAAAQPASPPDPTVPVDPYATPAAPAPELPAPEPWDPLDDDGWPKGVSLERMRHLRPCGLTEVLPGPGEVIPCRPEVIAEAPQWGLSLDWTTGIVAADVPVTGGAHALGVELGFGLTRALSIGPRYELMGVGLPTAGDELDLAASHRFLANARYRLFTDEVDRDAWTIGLGAGWAVQDAALGGGAPIVRASVGREVGMYLDDENAVGVGLELAYERNLDDARLSAVVAAARMGFEVNIRAPRNLGTLDEPASAAYTRGADVYLGPVLGLGYSVGVPVAGPLELTSTASFAFGLTDVGTISGVDGSQWAVQAGGRVTAGWPGPAPLYLQVQGGPVWVSSEPERRIAWALDTEVGVSPALGCDGRLDLAVRVRNDVEDGDVMWGALVLRLALGEGSPRAGRGCGYGAGAPPVVTMPTPPPPPPAPVEPAPAPGVDGGATVDAGGAIDAGGGAAIDAGSGAAIDAGGGVTVEVEPIVIEVELGAVWLGGAVEIRIDPRVLPLDKLRAAGHVEIELTGPADALADYEASLAATLDRQGIRADAWTRTATSGRVIRARFTLK
jgi:hypothetical protein